ncbi:hypothetical protein BH18ACI2_BH18ACI2_01450 [soil metagenome]
MKNSRAIFSRALLTQNPHFALACRHKILRCLFDLRGGNGKRRVVKIIFMQAVGFNRINKIDRKEK